jgi:hypothetical protein
MATSKFMSAVRHADEPATGLVAASRRTIVVIVLESRNSPEPLGPGELLFSVSNQ